MSWSDHKPSDSIRPLASESLRVAGFNGLIFERMSWRARSTVIIFSIAGSVHSKCKIHVVEASHRRPSEKGSVRMVDQIVRAPFETYRPSRDPVFPESIEGLEGWHLPRHQEGYPLKAVLPSPADPRSPSFPPLIGGNGGCATPRR